MAEDIVFEVAGWGAIEFAESWFAGEVVGGFEEAGDAEEGVAGCGGDEADFGVGFGGEGEYVLIQGGPAGLVGIECAAADGKDGHGGRLPLVVCDGFPRQVCLEDPMIFSPTRPEYSGHPPHLLGRETRWAT